MFRTEGRYISQKIQENSDLRYKNNLHKDLLKEVVDSARKEYEKNVIHDKYKVEQRQYMLPIYSTTGSAYQFDTMFNGKNGNPPAFLIIININSRRGYAYPMMNKGSKEVIKALNLFLQEAYPKPTDMTSDQDSAYLSNDITKWMLDNEIQHYTTTEHNHNVLGIINRFIKTLRDMLDNNAGPNEQNKFTNFTMQEIIAKYNTTPHSAIMKLAPNDFDDDANKAYIAYMMRKEAMIRDRPGFRLVPGQGVRTVHERNYLGKKRRNVSKVRYSVVGPVGSGVLIKAGDSSVAKFPRYKLINDDKAPPAKDIDKSKRKEILELNDYLYDSDAYKVIYKKKNDEGKNITGTVSVKQLREGNPTRIHVLEHQFWRKKGEGFPKRLRDIIRGTTTTTE